MLTVYKLSAVDRTQVKLVPERGLVYNIIQRIRCKKSRPNNLGMKVWDRPTFIFHTELVVLQTAESECNCSLSIKY